MSLSNWEDNQFLNYGEKAARLLANKVAYGDTLTKLLGSVVTAYGCAEKSSDVKSEVKIPDKQRPVPEWKSLPSSTQDDFTKIGYSQQTFDNEKDSNRLAILNTYVKLKGMKVKKGEKEEDLWRHVKKIESVVDGQLYFRSNDIGALKQDLTDRWNFRSPEESDKKWDSAEKRREGAIHFKHFEEFEIKGRKHTGKDLVEVHVDQAGVWAGNPYLWPAGAPINILPHLFKDYIGKGYTKSFDVREILLEQGWDEQTLNGIPDNKPKK